MARHAAVALFMLLPLLMLPLFSSRASEGSEIDTDDDGLTDVQELLQGTDLNNPDTDNDGFSDGDEVRDGFSPLHGNGVTLMEADTDGDYLIDAWEVILGTDILQPDSDGDLYLDGTEVAAGFDPLDINPIRLKKHITVSTKNLQLTYTFGDKILASIPVSTGKTSTPTPLGDFSVIQKYPTKWYYGPTWDYPDTKWNLHFTNANGWRYYIHGAYWHDNFGVAPVSGGCVNVRYVDMEPLYWFAQHGTEVSVI